MKKEEIKIIAKSKNELASDVRVGDDKYLILTEKGGPKTPYIITRIYLKGKILSTMKTDYKDMISDPDIESRVTEFMRRQHLSAISMFTSEKKKGEKTPSDYLEDVKILLRRKSQKNALELLKESLEQYPDDPFLLSYYGCLEAIVNKNYRFGIDTCNRAIEALKRNVPIGERFLYPVFYLNLGRAYLATGKKKNAIEAFNTGLLMNREDSELVAELKRLGIRKKPAVPFLSRSNPINKYIGTLLHKLRG